MNSFLNLIENCVMKTNNISKLYNRKIHLDYEQDTCHIMRNMYSNPIEINRYSESNNFPLVPMGNTPPDNNSITNLYMEYLASLHIADNKC